MDIIENAKDLIFQLPFGLCCFPDRAYESRIIFFILNDVGLWKILGVAPSLACCNPEVAERLSI